MDDSSCVKKRTEKGTEVRATIEAGSSMSAPGDPPSRSGAAQNRNTRRQRKKLVLTTPTPEPGASHVLPRIPDRASPFDALRQGSTMQQLGEGGLQSTEGTLSVTATSNETRTPIGRKAVPNSPYRRLGAAWQPKADRTTMETTLRKEQRQGDAPNLAVAASRAEELGAQPSSVYNRIRQRQKDRGNSWKTHGFTSRYMAAKGRHVKFSDDGSVSTVKHDEENLMEVMVGGTFKKDGKVQVMKAEPQVKEEPELHHSEDQLVKFKVQEETKSGFGPSILETVPDDVFFGILDVLSKPLIAHKYATIAKSEMAFKQLYTYNCAPGVLDNIASQHPFLKLAQTSKIMRNRIENYCQHATYRLLTTIIPSAEAKIKNKSIPEGHLVKKVKRMQRDEVRAKKLVVEGNTWRINWLSLSWRRCQFCGKATSRRAVFHFMTWCCHKCDTALWPKKKRNDIPNTSGTLIRAIHLDNVPAVFADARPLQVAYDWSVEERFYLKSELDALQERLMAEDPELKKTEEAELAEKRRQVRFGAVLMKDGCPWRAIKL